MRHQRNAGKESSAEMSSSLETVDYLCCINIAIIRATVAVICCPHCCTFEKIRQYILPSLQPRMFHQKNFPRFSWRKIWPKYSSGENWSKGWFPVRIIRRRVILIWKEKAEKPISRGIKADKKWAEHNLPPIIWKAEIFLRQKVAKNSALTRVMKSRVCLLKAECHQLRRRLDQKSCISSSKVAPITRGKVAADLNSWRGKTGLCQFHFSPQTQILSIDIGIVIVSYWELGEGRSHCSSSQCPPPPSQTSTPPPPTFFRITFNPFLPSLHLNVLQIQDMSQIFSQIQSFSREISFFPAAAAMLSVRRSDLDCVAGGSAVYSSARARQELVSTQHRESFLPSPSSNWPEPAL